MGYRECAYALLLLGAACGPLGQPGGGGQAQRDAAEPNASDSSTILPTSDGGWQLAWSDEFDESDGGAPDPAKWTFDLGGNGWGNQELEYYTSDRANSFLEAGQLVIRASNAGLAGKLCWYGACQFTSARMLTNGLFKQAYGRFEARMKIPPGQGLWPAFWMLGDDFDRVSWPACGEMDVMENIGRQPSLVHGSMHGPVAQGSSMATNITGTYTLPGGAVFSDAFHVFAVEWEPAAVRFYVDEMLYETRTPADNLPMAPWPYDHPYFLMLNLSVGGSFPGSPDGTTSFPADLVVDYVRVFTR